MLKSKVGAVSPALVKVAGSACCARLKSGVSNVSRIKVDLFIPMFLQDKKHPSKINFVIAPSYWHNMSWQKLRVLL